MKLITTTAALLGLLALVAAPALARAADLLVHDVERAKICMLQDKLQEKADIPYAYEGETHSSVAHVHADLRKPTSPVLESARPGDPPDRRLGHGADARVGRTGVLLRIDGFSRHVREEPRQLRQTCSIEQMTKSGEYLSSIRADQEPLR